MHLEAEYDAFAAKDKVDTVAVCHIAAPTEADARPEGVKPEDMRAPLDMTMVLDVSGSMDGEKLNLVKKTIHFLLTHLTSSDRLALVAFDSNVSTPLKLTYMDSRGKADAAAACDRLRAGSCTNLSGGLFAGIDIMKNRPARLVASSKPEIASLLLLTDGLMNEGIRDEADLVEATRRLLADGPTASSGSFTINTFGYGTSHNVKALKSLADASDGGVYYFIETNEAVAPSIGDCLGGLLTTMAQNLELTLTVAADGRCLIKKVETTRNCQLAPDGRSAVISLGDMQQEEVRDIVMRLELCSVAEDAFGDEAAVYVSASLRYVNVITGGFATGEAQLRVARPTSVPAEWPRSELVYEQVRRIEAASTLQDAMRKAEARDLAGARSVLDGWSAKYGADADEGAADLCMDVAEARENLVSMDRYVSKGSYAMSSAAQMHSAQRCNRFYTEEEEQCFAAASPAASKEGAKRGAYKTSGKMMFRGLFKS
jgi:Mg-chelatase subunit ChlD